MKWRIAIVEMYEHHESVSYLCKVLAPLAQIELYITPALEIDDFTDRPVHILNVRNGLSKALQDLITRTRDFDLIVNTTTMVDHRIWRCLDGSTVPWVTLVHNGNWMLSPRLNWAQLTITHGLRRLKWLASGALQCRHEVAGRFSGLIFPSRSIAKTFQGKIGVPALGIAWAIWGDGAGAEGGDEGVVPPTIIVPGSVLPTQRDYAVLGRALALIPADTAPLRVVILGEVRGRKAARAMSALRKRMRPLDLLQTFDRLVPDGAYADAWCTASCVISLSGGDMPFATAVEGGGVSKVTGVELDQIRFARHMLLPASYTGMPELVDWQTTFDTPDKLRDLIMEALTTTSESRTPSPAGFALEDHIAAWRRFLCDVMGCTHQ